MKIYLYYYDEQHYKYAKQDLQDPEMEIDDLGMSIYFNDFGNEITLDDNGLHSVIKIESLQNIWGVYFTNGNCIEGFHDQADITVKWF